MAQNIFFTDKGKRIVINRDDTTAKLLSIELTTRKLPVKELKDTLIISDPSNILDMHTAIAIVAYLWNNEALELKIDGFKIFYSQHKTGPINITRDKIQILQPISLSYDIIIKGLDVYKKIIADNKTTSYGIHLSTSEISFRKMSDLERYKDDRYREYIDHVALAAEQKELDKKIIDKINHGLKKTLLDFIDTYNATYTEARIMLRDLIEAGKYYGQVASTEPPEELEKIINHITLLQSKKAQIDICLSDQITRIEEYKKICFNKGINLDDITFPEHAICAPRRELTPGEKAAAIAQIITSDSFPAAPHAIEPNAKIAKIAEPIASLEPIIETQVHVPTPKSPPPRVKLKALHDTGNTDNDRSASITYGAKKMLPLGNINNIDGQENFCPAPHNPDDGRDVLGENYEFLLDPALLLM